MALDINELLGKVTGGNGGGGGSDIANIGSSIATGDFVGAATKILGSIFAKKGAPDYGTRKDVDYTDPRNTLISNVYYWLTNKDVQDQWDDTPFAHWYVFGKKEGRKWLDVESPMFTKDNSYAAVDLVKSNPELWANPQANRIPILTKLGYIKDEKQTSVTGTKLNEKPTQKKNESQTYLSKNDGDIPPTNAKHTFLDFIKKPVVYITTAVIALGVIIWKLVPKTKKSFSKFKK